MSFNQIVKQRMEELDIRPSELARKSGYSPQYIGDLLSGDRRWNETTMNKISEVLGIKMEFVIDERAATYDATGTE